MKLYSKRFHDFTYFCKSLARRRFTKICDFFISPYIGRRNRRWICELIHSRIDRGVLSINFLILFFKEVPHEQRYS